MGADNCWIGGDSGNENDWNTAANWSLIVPVATDDVRIPREATYAIDGFDATGVALDSFTYEEGCSIVLGDGGNPLLINVAANWTLLAGSGHVNIGGTLGTLGIDGDADVLVQDGATHAMVNIASGTVKILSNITTLNQSGGELTFGNAGQSTITLGTANILGDGTLVYNTSGTLTTANVKNGGTLDGGDDPRAATITNLNLYRGGKFLDPWKRFTLTNAVVLQEGGELELA